MLIRLLAIVIIASLFTACTSPPQDPPHRLRVLSYNIKHCRGEDNTFNYQRLADVIQSAKPDLVALQEVDVKTGRSSGVDQAARLGELTGMQHFFAEAMPYNGGSYGEAVLSRIDIQASHNISLDAPSGHEPRSAAFIRLLLPGDESIEIAFAGTHLCHQTGKVRLAQAKQLNQAQQWRDAPSILAGDFNFTPDSEPYRAIIAAGWVDTAASFGNPKPTFPSKNARIRIDYVFVRPAERWRVIDVQVMDEPVASDHAPVLVELEYIQP